ncbi:MAG: hypothetical protein ACKVP7_28475 [Hyphomicrobiaceae bacterium]
MSNRTVLEFNHDLKWTKDLEQLGRLLDSVRRSIPIGDHHRDVAIRDGLEQLGITYITTRHHSDARLDEQVAALKERVQRLEDDKKKLVKAGKAAASALDTLMGDSDLDDDQSPEFKACQRMNKVLDAVSKPSI